MSVATLLSPAEFEFLARHRIAVSQVIDARGLTKQERRLRMRSYSALLAVGNPCAAHGHRLLTSPGHCVACDPKKLAFAKRYRATGQVYVARSSSLTLTKIGSSVDASARIAQLNSDGYGGATDWRLISKFETAEAGKVEFTAHASLADCRTPGRYRKGGELTECYELFACPPEVATTLLTAIISGLASALGRPGNASQGQHKRVRPWRKGDRLTHPGHPEWGIGTVLANGDTERVEIHFEFGGERILCPSFANLIRAKR